MRTSPTLAKLAIASFTFTIVAACSSSQEHEDADVTVQLNGPSIEAKPNPCPTVECADGRHCESRGKKASCVPDPACTTDADCYLFTGLCSGAYACRCVAHENTVRGACSGTSITCTHPPCDGYTAGCVNGACAKVAVGTATTCVSDNDCRLFANSCNGCSCQALTGWSPDPACSGTPGQCTADPCLDASAVCTGGTCTVFALQ